MTDIATHADHRHDHDAEYPVFAAALHDNFNSQIEGATALFRTDAADLFDIYLENLAGAADRQTHNCSTCKRFFEQFGGLVRIDGNGQTIPVMWTASPETVQHLPPYYLPALEALHVAVAKAKVIGVFLSSETTWGIPVTGDWSHLHVNPPPKLVYRHGRLTARQAMAEQRENYRQVAEYLGDVNPVHLAEAIRVFETESVDMSAKFTGPLLWLRDLQRRPKGRVGENLLWHAVATAPNGYCHPRSAVTHSLIEDIAAGMKFDDVKRRFNAKVGALQYQRPQAPPTAGAVKQAEKLFADLGLQDSLPRRYARFEDIPEFVWKPTAAEPAKAGGLFGHLATKTTTPFKPVDLPPVTMTWDKFARIVLPGAEKIEALAPLNGNYVALVTAANPEAPPIIKWDQPDARNPVSWYVYPGGSRASQWGLTGNAYVPVTGITKFPNLWGGNRTEHLAEGVVVILQGAADTALCSAALFPSLLKEDLHGVRAVIEAYSKAARIEDRSKASACGLDLRKGQDMNTFLRVTAGGTATVYKIDRWD